MLFEHVCLLFMSIGIILIIVGNILYIKNENDSKKASEDRQIVLRNQRMQRLQRLQNKKRVRKIINKLSTYTCITQSDKLKASDFKNRSDVLKIEGDRLLIDYNNYEELKTLINNAISILNKISDELDLFIGTVLCDDQYCSNKYNNSIYNETDNSCECDKNKKYTNIDGVCTECKSPNIFNDGICFSNCNTPFIYENGACICPSPYVLNSKNECVDPQEVSDFIDAVNKLNMDISTDHINPNIEPKPELSKITINDILDKYYKYSFSNTEKEILDNYDMYTTTQNSGVICINDVSNFNNNVYLKINNYESSSLKPFLSSLKLTLDSPEFTKHFLSNKYKNLRSLINTALVNGKC